MSDDSGLVRKLTPTEWAPFVSRHSLPGARPETFEFTSIEIDGRRLKARCRMVWYRLRQDGRWHLRAVVATQMSGELKKIHAHILEGLDQREFTAILTSLQMEFHRAIRDPERIDIDLRLIDEKVTRRDDALIKRFTWEFDFCEGAFVCKSTGHYRRATAG